MATTSGSTTYRLEPAMVWRAIGPAFVVIGLAWVLVSLLDGGSPVRITLASVTFALVVAGVVAVLRPPRVLTLSPGGFRVSLLRGAGTASGDWVEVDSVDTTVARGGPSIVMTLSGGRFTVVPLSVLGRRNAEAQREIHDRLNDAYGYRHLDAS